ncbi:MAG: RIO1 family regulatory kinase/ATPase domain-containing protein [Candidatus Kariarchaeaceae archaeon]
MGIDIEIGSPTNPTYAIYFDNGNSSGTKIFTEVQPGMLMSLITQFKPQIIASDNIRELLITKIMTDYLIELQEVVELIQVTAANPSQMTSVLHEARRAGIPLRNKPWPVQTAIICTMLAIKKIGSKAILSKKGGKLSISFETINSLRPRNSPKAMLDIDPSKEMTERETYKLLSEHPIVDQVLGIVGAGKESNVYLIIDRNGDPAIIKSFKTYTSVADILRSSNFHLKAHHAPILLAKLEERNLKRFEHHKILAPRVRFRDGSLVGMDAILNDNGDLVKPLSEFKSQLSKDQIELLLENILDNLYNIFKKCGMVHGDFSANNILYDGNKMFVIDVSQAEYVNFNTFIDTPKRIRFDHALEVLIRDLLGILSFFEKNFRVKLEREIILSQFVNLIPNT